jgi:Pyruvate/2-oxoacid:ferredoxin oxidoreductase gamma subunit
MKHFNSALFSNTLVLGVMAKLVEGLEKGIVLESILDIIPKFQDKNKEAFEIGYSYFQ